MTAEKRIRITVDGTEANKSIDDINKKSKDAKKSIDKFTSALQSMLKYTGASFSALSTKVKSFSDALKSSSVNLFVNILRKLTDGMNKLHSSLSKIIVRFKAWGRDIHKHPIKNLRKVISKVNTGLHFMAARFAALAVGFSSIIKANNLFTNFHATMSVVVDDSKKVEEEWKFVTETADKLGVSLLGVVEPYARLKAALQAIEPSGLAAKAMFEGIATAAVVLHKPVADTNLMFLAMEQVASKGKLSLEELQKQFAQKVPGAMLIASEAAGFGAQRMGEFFTAIRKGTVDVGSFMKSFGTGLSEHFKAGLEIASNSFQAISNRLSNVFTHLRIELSQGGFIQGVNKVLNSLIDKLGTSGVTQAVTRLSNEFGNLFNIAADWIDSITSQNVADIIDIITAAVKSTGKLVKKILGMSKGQDLVDTFKVVAESILGIAETIFSIIKSAADFLKSNSGVKDANAGPNTLYSSSAYVGGASVASVVGDLVNMALNAISTTSDNLGILYDKIVYTKVGVRNIGTPYGYSGPIPNDDGTFTSAVTESSNKVEAAVVDLNAEMRIMNTNTNQFLTKLATFENRGTTFADRTKRAGKSATEVAITRAGTASREPAQRLREVEAELKRVNKMVKDNDIVLNDHNKGLIFSLEESRARLMGVLSTIKIASESELSTIKDKEAKKAEIVRNSFDKLLAHSSNNFELELRATRNSLKDKYDAHAKHASDIIAFDKSFSDAKLRALDKFIKDSAKVGSSDLSQGLRKSTSKEGATTLFNDSMTNLSSQESTAIGNLPSDIIDRNSAIKDIETGFNEERAQRRADFHARIAEIDLKAFETSMEMMREREQAGLDLKSEFSSATSSSQQANLGNMANAFESFSKTIWTKDKKTGEFSTKNEAKTWKGRLSIASSAMTAMSGLMDSGNKKLFLLGKASAIGSATIDTFMAVNKALASAPPPFNFALAAIVGAVGIANVAKIASTPFGGSASTASVPSAASSSSISAPTTPNPVAEPAAPPPQQITIIIDGVTSIDHIVNDLVPAALRDQVLNNDTVIIDPRSRQAMLIQQAA